MTQNRASCIDVKKVNRNRIYKLIYDTAGVSKPEIAHRLKMSLPTVMQNIRSLSEMGLVKENGNQESTGGRKAVVISAVNDARFAVGLDITRSQIASTLVNLQGEVIRSTAKTIPFSESAAYVEKIGILINEMIDAAGINRSRIIGAGISIPGVLAKDGDRLITSHVLLVDNYTFSAITSAIGFPCWYVNDANAAGFSELWNAETGDNFVYLSLSNSVGGAVVLNKTLRIGDNQRCGELGHMTVERDGLRCYCGKKGCLDAYCSAALLAERTGGDLTAFFQKMDAGDSRFRAVWEDYLDYLATAANTLHMILDLDVVIGGYIGAYMESRISDLRARAAKLNTFANSADYIRVCRYKQNASAIGAALCVVNHFIESI